MAEKISFEGDNGLEEEMFVLSQTVVEGISYILVTQEEEGDSDAMILKCVPGEEDEEKALYETVTDEEELNKAIAAFSEILDDVEFEED